MSSNVQIATAKGILRQYRCHNRSERYDEVKRIKRALKKLNHRDRNILWQKYINIEEPNNTFIYMEMHISESKFYRDFNSALIKFAEAHR